MLTTNKTLSNISTIPSFKQLGFNIQACNTCKHIDECVDYYTHTDKDQLKYDVDGVVFNNDLFIYISNLPPRIRPHCISR